MTLAPKGTIEVVQYSDPLLDEVLAFLKKWTADHPELSDRSAFQWQKYVRSLAILNGRIVGHVAQVPQTMIYRKERLNVGWGASFVLDTSNPIVQAFAGTALLDKVTLNPELKFAAIGIRREIEEPFQRRGFKVVRGPLRMYMRPLDPIKILRYLEKPLWLSPFLKLGNLASFISTKRIDKGIIEIERFEPEWDSVWESFLAECSEFHGERTAGYLNFKLSQPGKQYSSHLYLGATGHPDGYVIYRRATHPIKALCLIKIVDLVGSPEAKRKLASHVMSLANDTDVAGVVSLSSAEDGWLLFRSGMWIKRLFPVALPASINGRMYLSFFDSDLDDLW